jgi:KipI family sensor histidine kinase inhibitor
LQVLTRPVGARALLAEVADAGQALSLALWARGRVSAVEIVPAACTVLFDGCSPESVAGQLTSWEPGAEAPVGQLVEIPVSYDGPDLGHLADTLGLGVDDLVSQHTGSEHVAAFCGFSPGFSYLTGSSWEVPRLATPRQRVDPGSVGLAGPFTGIYPTASPGGWQIIGRTDAVLWDAGRVEPALLPPGTRVRFVAR